MATPINWRIVGSFAVIYLVWGSTFLGLKVAVETIPPLSMAAIRFLSAGTLLMLATIRIKPRPTFSQWRNALFIGSLFFLLNHGLVSSAARYIPSSLSCLIIATEVPMIALLSSVLLRNQPLTRYGLFGAVLGIGGVAWLFLGQGHGTGSINLFACLAVLGGAIGWSFGAVLSQRLDLPADAILRAAMQTFCGGILLFGASLIHGELVWHSLESASARSLMALTYLIVFGSILGFACYSYLLKHVRSDAVATHVFVNPLVALGLGAWLGGEKLQATHLVSGLLILSSVAVITFGQSRKPTVEIG